MNDKSESNYTAELAGLEPPEHLPGFWEELEHALADSVSNGRIATDQTSTGRADDDGSGRFGNRLLVGAAALLLVAGLTGLVWRQVGSSRIETGGSPTIDGTGGIEGPFPWMVQGSHDGRELLLSRPTDGDGTPCFPNDQGERSVHEVLILDLGVDGGPPEPVPVIEVPGFGRFFERIATPGPSSQHVVHNFCTDDGRRLALIGVPDVGTAGVADPTPNVTPIEPPDEYPLLLTPAVWRIEDGRALLTLTFYNAPDDGDGPINRLRADIDPATGQTLDSEPVDATLLAVLADGTEIQKTDSELLVDGAPALTDYSVFVDQAEPAPDGSSVAVFGYSSGAGIVILDGSGTPRYEDLTGPVVDVAWLPDGRLVVANGSRPDPSSFEIVDLSGPAPSIRSFDPGIGPIVAESVTAIAGDRLAISGTTRSAPDSTWFVPLPPAEEDTSDEENSAGGESTADGDGPAGDGIGSTSGDDLAGLVPTAALFGPEWQDSGVSILAPQTELYDPDEDPAGECGPAARIVVPSGYIAEYGVGESPDDAIAVVAEGTVEEIDGLFQGFVAVTQCEDPSIVFDEVTIDGAGAVSFETQDRSGVLVNYGNRFLYLDVSHVEGVEPVDVIELVTTLGGS